MKRTFKTEDGRKTNLFHAWIKHLEVVHANLELDSFEEIYEGLATVSEISKNRLGLHLEDRRKLRGIPIPLEISNLSCRLDSMYVILGRREGRWNLLEVISIGSLIGARFEEVHITFNPLYALSPDVKCEKSIQ